MTNLAVEVYYPCLAPLEKGAIQYAHSSVVPPYIFVIPVQPMTDYYNASPDNFDGRQQFWADMFRFGRTTIEVLGEEIDVYIDPYGFIDQWNFYIAVHGSWPTLDCRMMDYTEVVT